MHALRICTASNTKTSDTLLTKPLFSLVSSERGRTFFLLLFALLSRPAHSSTYACGRYPHTCIPAHTLKQSCMHDNNAKPVIKVYVRLLLSSLSFLSPRYHTYASRTAASYCTELNSHSMLHLVWRVFTQSSLSLTASLHDPLQELVANLPPHQRTLERDQVSALLDHPELHEDRGRFGATRKRSVWKEVVG